VFHRFIACFYGVVHDCVPAEHRSFLYREFEEFFPHRGNPYKTTAISGKKMSYDSNIDAAAVDKAVKQVQAGKTSPFEVVVRRYERPLRGCASAPDETIAGRRVQSGRYAVKH